MCASAFSLSIIVGCWIAGRPTERPSSQEGVVAHPGSPSNGPGWRRVDSTGQIADEILAQTSRRLTDLSMPVPDQAALSRDFATILRCMFTNDFQSYDTMMLQKGCQLDDLAAGFSEYLASSTRYDGRPDQVHRELVQRFDGHDAAALRTAPVRDKLEYMWDHPAPRDMAVARADLDSVRCGTGFQVNPGPSWQWTGSYLQRSVYCPPGGRLMEDQGNALDGTVYSVWVQLDVVFDNQVYSTIRLIFYYDEQRQTWFPLYSVVGDVHGVRPLPMI